MIFETLNELTLKVHAMAGETIFTKAGAFIMGESLDGKNYKFEKVLLGPQGNPVVAVLTDGNPLVFSNQQNGSTLVADPDALVCWTGADPGFKLDLSWKNLIGQASGESYMFEWSQPATIIVQPMERKSGLDISMDGRRTGTQASRQQNQTLGSAANNTGQALSQVGNLLSGNFNQGQGTNGGLGGIINNLFH